MHKSNGNTNGGGMETGAPFTNPVEKFEEAFMSCLSALTKEDTLTNVDKDEIRVDVENGISTVIEAARSMESYFLKKRLEIAAQKPELLVKDDCNELKLELMRKDELLKKNYEKIGHWQSILSDIQANTTAGAAGKLPGTPLGHSPGVLGHSVGISQPMSQGPHTPQSQGPMTPTSVGRPNTPGAGRPHTPGSMGGVRMQQNPNVGYSPSMHHQSIGSPQIGPHNGGMGGAMGGAGGLQELRSDKITSTTSNETSHDQNHSIMFPNFVKQQRGDSYDFSQQSDGDRDEIPTSSMSTLDIEDPEPVKKRRGRKKADPTVKPETGDSKKKRQVRNQSNETVEKRTSRSRKEKASVSSSSSALGHASGTAFDNFGVSSSAGNSRNTTHRRPCISNNNEGPTIAVVVHNRGNNNTQSWENNK